MAGHQRTADTPAGIYYMYNVSSWPKFLPFQGEGRKEGRRKKEGRWRKEGSTSVKEGEGRTSMKEAM